MQRPRLHLLIGGTITALALGPVLGAVALAADPVVVVKPGDTLTAISRRHDVGIERLVKLNRLTDPNRIYAGQRLRTGASAEPDRPSPPATRVHVVNRGSNLTWIARQYGVSVNAIVTANRLANPSRIFAGQRLIIPGSTPPAAARPAASTPTKPATTERVHVVQRGENLTSIGRRYGVSVSAIASANGITNPSRIFGGQRLTIPGSRPATATKPSSAKASMPASMATLVARRDAVRRVIIQEADRYRVPRAFALAVAWQESGWQQGVVSHAGAVGVMQLLPATAEWVGEGMLGTRVNIRDTRHNVRAGVRLLAHYLDRYHGDRALVLAAYYQGQTAADRHGIYPVSRPYIASIKVLERLFGG